jgi:hypothetical protein
MPRRKASHSAASTPKEGKTSASELLDELLPLIEPTVNEVHYRAAVLEVSDPAQLLELVADPGLRPFLLCRLAPTVALIDPGCGDELVEVLRRRGHTPKVLR